MGLATITCGRAKKGVGQKALKRLLHGNAAKLSSNVADGAWKPGLYPSNKQAAIAAGLIWFALGSPKAGERWMAAHSVRSLAKLGRWDVVKTLVAHFSREEARPYQAPELQFYFYHARLWLLIALARLAWDYPERVCGYQRLLKKVALDTNSPHVLIQHFASAALLTCAAAGHTTLDDRTISKVRNVNESPYATKRAMRRAGGGFYEPRPNSMPEPDAEFDLDYEFGKNEVMSVSYVFNKSMWEVRDGITAWVRRRDSTVSGMYEKGGREINERDQFKGVNAVVQGYGQQLGWHALYGAASELLAKYPVVQTEYEDRNPWKAWLRRQLLTRADGLWLADGLDRPPLPTQVNLMETHKMDEVLTGDKSKLLALVGIGQAISERLVVAGHWRSSDDVSVFISSALVSPKEAKTLAKELAAEDPFMGWLPRLEGDHGGGEYSHNSKEKHTAWLVWPSTETGLDSKDPLGAGSAVNRPRFSSAVNQLVGLKTTDSFRRRWVDGTGKEMAISEAWGHTNLYNEENSKNGERLICDRRLLRKVLTMQKNELLLSVVLRRHKQGHRSEPSKYWHTSAVIRVKNSLAVEYYRGAVNQLDQSKY
jgi:hypothetical protein